MEYGAAQIPGRLWESVLFMQGGAFQPPDHRCQREFCNFVLRKVESF
jgi:hypothetical protein